MEVKLGGWSRHPIRKMLKVSSRSPGVIQDQMAYHCCMDLKLGGWRHFLMPTFLKVSSRTSGVAQGPIGLLLLYGHESWWIIQFKYITFKLGEGIRLGQGKTKFECFGDAMPGRGLPRSIPFYFAMIYPRIHHCKITSVKRSY